MTAPVISLTIQKEAPDMWYLKTEQHNFAIIDIAAKVNYKCGIQPYLTCTLRCKTRFQYKAAATDFSNPSLALALFSTIKTIKEKTENVFTML